MTRLLLIRHGANDAQKSDILTGWTPGVHLNQAGRAQAQALAQRLASVEVAAVYASPLERTLETAEIVAAPHGLPVVVREDLGEVRLGRWTGQPLEKLRKRRLWRKVQFVPSVMRFPGGESFQEVQSRAVAELERLCAEHPQQTVAVVSHADVIKAAVAYTIGLHLDLFQRLVIAPASLTVLEVGGLMPHLLCLNDIGHLSVVSEEKEESTTPD
ncbi:MAG: MSMEG_4193 family putative phosphomutase [Anaerolineae bacterium]|nr:MSMEG_4193 family putative phosphomutase [Anaerolineae bacterium]